MSLKEYYNTQVKKKYYPNMGYMIISTNKEHGDWWSILEMQTYQMRKSMQKFEIRKLLGSPPSDILPCSRHIPSCALPLAEGNVGELPN
jgi:hypothetical protein